MRDLLDFLVTKVAHEAGVALQLSLRAVPVLFNAFGKLIFLVIFTPSRSIESVLPSGRGTSGIRTFL